MEDEPLGAPILPPTLDLVGGGPGGGVGLGLGVAGGGGPLGLGRACGLNLTVAGAPGVLGAGDLGRGGGGGVPCCFGVVAGVDMVHLSEVGSSLGSSLGIQEVVLDQWAINWNEDTHE